MTKRIDWTTGDMAVLREHYPLGGARAVWAALPAERKRSFEAIACAARKCLIALKVPATRERRASTPEIDAAIRARVAAGTISRRFGVSRPWVCARARALKVPYDVRVPRRWAPEELAILARSESKGNGAVRYALRQAGFNRSTKAIIEKRSKLRISGRREFDGYFSLSELSGLLGRNPATIARFANRRVDPLQVRREGQMYLFKERDVREWIARNPEAMDFTKLPRENYPWFVEFMTGIAPPRQD